MPIDPNITPIESEWYKFTGSLRLLLVPQPDDRPLDQYLKFRDDVMALVEGPDFMLGLRGAWPPFTDNPLKPVGDLLVAELRAFPLAVEVAQAQEKTGSGEKGWVQRWLGRGSTIAASARELLENAPPLVKCGLIVLGELLDLFKGD